MATKSISVVTGGNNNATVTAAEINAIATDFIADGVVGAISLNTGSGGTGSFAVNAQGTPNMTVRVSAGQAYITATPSGGTSQRIRVSMDTYEDVNISANSTGSTRYDFLYLVVSASALANPGANKDDVVTLTTSRSTSSATDNGTPPTYGYKLGVITVANGASSITNSNITDSRTRTGAQTTTAQIPNANVTADKLSTGATAAYVATGENTSSTSFTDLSTVTDTVTVTIGANGIALVNIACTGSNNTSGAVWLMGFAISGASTVAASDDFAIQGLSPTGTQATRIGATYLVTGLTAGSTTFKAKYRVPNNTGTFTSRRISVVPL